MSAKQSMMNSKNQDTKWVSVLTVLSCVAVVYLHVNAIYWLHPDGIVWYTSNFIECLFYFAVPCFFMLSGYTLLDYRQRYNTMLFLKKRFARVFVPFFVWSVLYYLVYNDMHFNTDFWSRFLHCKIEYTFYFFYQILFCCYLSMICFSLIPNKILCFKWLSVCCFIIFSVLPFLDKAKLLNVPDLQLFSYWQPLLFCFLGYFLGNINLSLKYRIFIYVLGFIGFLFHYFGTALISFPNEINQFFKGYYNFPSVFYATAIFVWCKYHNWDFIFKSETSKSLFNKVLSCSLSIYLVHIMIVYHTLPAVFGYFGINNYPIQSFTYRIIAPLVIILIICYLITFSTKILPMHLHFLLGYKNVTPVKKECSR